MSTIYRYCDILEMPRDIKMQEFYHDDGSLTFVGQYINAKNRQPANHPKRVYKIEVLRDIGDWRAAVFEDNTLLVTLRGEAKWVVAYAALGALRGILYKRCVAARSNRRAKSRAKKASTLLHGQEGAQQ